jgi:hypothetical protein
LPGGRRRGLVAGALGALVALSVLATEDGPVLCPFRRCSGGYCPGCGMTRAWGRLLRGDLAGSWARHPYLILALAQVAVLGGTWRLASGPVRLRMERLLVPLAAANLALLIGIWVVRLVQGAIPPPFAG